MVQNSSQQLPLGKKWREWAGIKRKGLELEAGGMGSISGRNSHKQCGPKKKKEDLQHYVMYFSSVTCTHLNVC